MAQRHRWPSPDTFDDLFLRHYATLVAQAQQLVGRDRQAAEDLVHDVYLRLALRQFDFGGVHNVEGYLFMTLRNVHLSQVRRRLSKVSATVSMIDHESVVSGLRSVANDEERRSAYDALCHVVRYACLRKPTSKAASVLILRFFHGYYPGEIARVVQTTETAVAGRLRMARAEARAYLAAPQRLQPFDERRATLRLDVSHDDVASVRALRQAIFDARTGACLSGRAIEHLYASRASDSIDVATLAHLVSCATCLDAINRWLGLPLLIERDPADSLGRGGPPNGRGGGTGAADVTSVLRARLKQATDDHPQELQIAVNGLFVSAQAVSGPMNEQRLRILMPEQVGFIEVFDEYETCLLYLDVEPPPHGAVEQSTRVLLSDGRRLSATVAFADASPTLHVVYDNPPAAVESTRSLEPHQREPDETPSARWWSQLWPVPFRFVLAGLVLGVLLANPRQTLAAIDQMRRVIADSIVQIIDSMRPRVVLPSRPVRPADTTPFAAPAASLAPMVSAPRSLAREDLTDIELAETVLEALHALDGVGALTREQVDVELRADRLVHVEGIVENTARRDELGAALGAFNSRRLRLDLVTVDEAARQRRTATAPTSRVLQLAEVTREREPVAFEHVRRYVIAAASDRAGAAEPTGEPGALVRQYSAAVLGHARQARVQARTVRDLVGRVNAADVEQLSPSAIGTWRALVRRHAELFRQETASLRQKLERVFPQADDEAATPATPERDAWQMGARLFELGSAHDAAVSHAFAVVAPGSESMTASTPAFRQSLVVAERLVDTLLAAMPGAAMLSAAQP